MGEYVWSHGDEMSWVRPEGTEHDWLILRTTREERYLIRIISGDFISMTPVQTRSQGMWSPSYHRRLILARLGSDPYWGLIRFYHCVNDNSGKALHLVEKCEAPFEPFDVPTGFLTETDEEG